MSSRTTEDATLRLRELRTMADKLRVEVARSEASLEMLKTRKDEIRRELAALDVDPDRVDEELSRLELEIKEAMAQADRLLSESESLTGREGAGDAGATRREQNGN